jgi:hypothetical protein
LWGAKGAKCGVVAEPASEPPPRGRGWATFSAKRKVLGITVRSATMNAQTAFIVGVKLPALRFGPDPRNASTTA